jgi:hypothetical protein
MKAKAITPKEQPSGRKKGTSAAGGLDEELDEDELAMREEEEEDDEQPHQSSNHVTTLTRQPSCIIGAMRFDSDSSLTLLNPSDLTRSRV